MTLTSSLEGGAVQLRRHFQTLRYRIEHKFGRKLEYCCISTNEGAPAKISGKHGVLHILFKGMYIPHAWLSRSWEEIHGAPIVYLQKFYGSAKKITSYLSNYYAHHDDTRLSWSHGWVCRNFVRMWKEFKYYYKGDYKELIYQWNLWLKRPILVGLYEHVYWDEIGQMMFQDYVKGGRDYDMNPFIES